MVVSMQNETKRVDSIRYNPSGTGMSSSKFIVTELRDDDGSLDAAGTTATVINSGDLVIVCLRVQNATYNSSTAPNGPPMNMSFPTREPVRLEIKPEHGGTVIKDIITPPSYSVEYYITLFP